MELRDIKELMKILKKEEMSEIKVRYGKIKLTLKNGEEQKSVGIAPVSNVIEKEKVEVAKVPVVKEEIIKSQNVGHIKLIKTEKGVEVTKGMVLAKISTIGIETDVKSSVSGTLKEVLVADNSPVDYAKPLFIIETE